MRISLWLAALTLGLCLTGTASAQRANTWGSTSQPLSFKIVDTSSSVAGNMPISRPQSISNRRGFYLRDYLPSFSGLNNNRYVGQSNFPKQKDMPGVDYLKAFKYGRGVPIVP